LFLRLLFAAPEAEAKAAEAFKQYFKQYDPTQAAAADDGEAAAAGAAVADDGEAAAATAAAMEEDPVQPAAQE
jgi:hypothetical protein